MWTYILIAICTLLLFLVFKLIDLRSRYASILNYPGPKGLPILGNALDMGTNSVEFMANLIKHTKQYGPLTQMWIGLRPFIFVTDVKMTAFLLSSINHIEKTKDYKFIEPWLGNGLLISSGEKWKKRRKIITPAFHFKILEDFLDIFHTSADILVEQLSKTTDMKQVDIYPYITRYALDVICETAMGTCVNVQQDMDSVYFRAVNNACNLSMKRSFSAWKQFDFLYQFSSEYRENKAYLKILHEFTRSVISKRRDDILKDISKEEEEKDDKMKDLGMKKKFAFLDILLKSTIDGQPLSDDDIREEVDTFMFEGHDTTASGMSFSLYTIANYPDVQEKIVQEINTICNGDMKKALTFSDLNQMKYLDMVIKEVLRLYPSVPLYGRELQEDVNYGGTILPKGLTLGLFPYGLQRDPEIYPNPEAFDPDRFLSENFNKDIYSYIPFSAGQRNCIGQKFAMLEMKATITKILQNFELSTAGPEFKPVLSMALVLKPANGVHIKFKKRST